MATMTVEREKLVELLQQWLKRTGNGTETVEVLLLPHQFIVREPSPQDEEFDRWAEGYFGRRDSLMQRLSDA